MAELGTAPAPLAAPFLPRQSNSFSCLSFPIKQGRPTQRCLPHEGFEGKNVTTALSVNIIPFVISLQNNFIFFLLLETPNEREKTKKQGIKKTLAQFFHYMAQVVCVTQMGYVCVQQRRLELGSGRSYEMCF